MAKRNPHIVPRSDVGGWAVQREVGNVGERPVRPCSQGFTDRVGDKIMLQTLKLLLPALIPSWRFFDTIAPSPRIEFTLLKTAQDAPGDWRVTYANPKSFIW